MRDPKERFSNRVEDYVRYRPGYPREVRVFLEQSCGLTSSSVVADVGSGTGALSRLFLENGNRTFGVEPNDEMRAAGERLLGGYPGFESVAGSAEATTLADDSVDLVAVGNAFHWIDAVAARREFSRVLRPGGVVAIVWGSVREEGSPFLEAFASFLVRYGVGGTEGGIEELYCRTEGFLGGEGYYVMGSFASSQRLDLASLEGLVFSFSSIPNRGAPGSEAVRRDLAEIFGANESGGVVAIEYAVRVYCGRPARGTFDGPGGI